jgi:hypothetical protein
MSFGGGSGSSSISGSTDVVLSSPANNQVLGYNYGTAKWQNQTKTLGPCCTCDPRSLKATVTTFPATNRTYFMRVQGAVAGATAYLIWVGTASGNISIANYANSGTGINAAPTGSPRGVTGSVACPATGAQLVFASGGAFNVAEGDWIGLSCDNGTASFGSGMDGAPTELYAGLCCANNVFPAGTPSSPYTATKPFFVAAEYATAPVGGSPAYIMDYQTGDFSQWYEQHYLYSTQQAIVTTPARSGYPYSAQFIVAPGDAMYGATDAERSDVITSVAQTGNVSEGDAQWYAWSSFFPTGTYVDTNAESPVGNGWLEFTEWHHDNLYGPANIMIMLNQGTPVTARLAVNGQSLTVDPLNPGLRIAGYVNDWNLGLIPINSWVDFTVYIVWSTDPTLGHVTVKMNGTQVADVVCPTLYPGMSVYLVQGIYRSNCTRTHTIYHTGTRRGSTEGSVAL